MAFAQTSAAASTAAPQLTRFPGNGTYNARRFDAARKELAAAMAAPVFTDEERQRALVNGWNAYSLYQLMKWTRNVQRVAAERAVAAAKARTAEAELAKLAAAPRPVFEYGAFRMKQARRIIMETMGNSVFSAAERLRANDAAYQSNDLRQLAIWQRNVKRLAAEREAELWAAHEAGAESFVAQLTR